MRQTEANIEFNQNSIKLIQVWVNAIFSDRKIKVDSNEWKVHKTQTQVKHLI